MSQLHANLHKSIDTFERCVADSFVEIEITILGCIREEIEIL